jgi:hypothetical protein
MKQLLLAGTAFVTLAISQPAQAAYIVTLAQQGSDTIATGSGTIDLAGLSLDPICGGTACVTPAQIVPNIAVISTGLVIPSPSQLYNGFTGPTSFGSGDVTGPTSGSGDIVRIDGFLGLLSVPFGYVSGSPLSDSSTYDNHTFSSLGVTPGTYVWTWGSGATADSFTLIAVPGPIDIGRRRPARLVATPSENCLNILRTTSFAAAEQSLFRTPRGRGLITHSRRQLFANAVIAASRVAA